MDNQKITSIMYNLSPYEFEEFIAEIWELQGWNAKVTSGSSDRGIDVIANRDTPFKQKQLIQAKKYNPEKSIGSQEIRRYATLYQQEQDVDVVVLVTTGTFTSQAENLAKDLDVKIIDKNALTELISELDAEDLLFQYSGSKEAKTESQERKENVDRYKTEDLSLVSESEERYVFEDISKQYIVDINTEQDLQKVLQSFRQFHSLVGEFAPGVFMEIYATIPEIQEEAIHKFTSANLHQFTWLGAEGSPKLNPILDTPGLEVGDVQETEITDSGEYLYTLYQRIYNKFEREGFDIDRETETITTILNTAFGLDVTDIDYISTPLPTTGEYTKSELENELDGDIYLRNDWETSNDNLGYAADPMLQEVREIGPILEDIASAFENISKFPSTPYILAQKYLGVGPKDLRQEGLQTYLEARTELKEKYTNIGTMLDKRQNINPDEIPYYDTPIFNENTTLLEELQVELHKLMENTDSFINKYTIDGNVEDVQDVTPRQTNASVLTLPEIREGYGIEDIKTDKIIKISGNIGDLLKKLRNPRTKQGLV